MSYRTVKIYCSQAGAFVHLSVQPGHFTGCEDKGVKYLGSVQLRALLTVHPVNTVLLQGVPQGGAVASASA